jgi:hypothetical protein
VQVDLSYVWWLLLSELEGCVGSLIEAASGLWRANVDVALVGQVVADQVVVPRTSVLLGQPDGDR